MTAPVSPATQVGQRCTYRVASGSHAMTTSGGADVGGEAVHGEDHDLAVLRDELADHLC
jgi:hypothetical protein